MKFNHAILAFIGFVAAAPAPKEGPPFTVEVVKFSDLDPAEYAASQSLAVRDVLSKRGCESDQYCWKGRCHRIECYQIGEYASYCVTYNYNYGW